VITANSRYKLATAYATRDPARAEGTIRGVRPHRAGKLSSRCQHRVISTERLDHLADLYYQDPLLYWLICDAEDAIFPEDLLVPGKILRIPLNEP